MDKFFISIIVLWILLILAAETVLWNLFKRQIVRICIPTKGICDMPFHRALSLKRLSLITLLHTLLLTLITVGILIILW